MSIKNQKSKIKHEFQISSICRTRKGAGISLFVCHSEDTPQHMTEQILLPEHFPLAGVSRMQLKRALPSSKTAYVDKYLTPFLHDIQNSLIESISFRLEIAAQKYNFGSLNNDEYAKEKDKIYESLVNGDWISDIHNAFQQHSVSTDAFSLMLNDAFSVPETDLNITNLDEYVEDEQQTMETLGRPKNESISEKFDYYKNLDSTRTNNIDKVEANKEILKLKQLIFVATYPERPLLFSLERDPSDDKEADPEDDLEVGGGKVDLTCPISRQIITKAYKNLGCKHTYDLDPLKQYLKSSQKCPECGAPVGLSSIEPDLIMQTRIDCYRRDLKFAELIKDRRNDDIDKL